jgi:hypothetical protein
MYVNVMETRVQKEVRDLSRVLAHVLTDCLRGGIPSRLLAATIVPRGHAPVAVRLDPRQPYSSLRRSEVAVQSVAGARFGDELPGAARTVDPYVRGKHQARVGLPCGRISPIDQACFLNSSTRTRVFSL